VLHPENDGHAYVRHGVEACDTMIDITEVAALERNYSKQLVEQVQAALAEMTAADRETEIATTVDKDPATG
jgi:hypothetical protein